MDYDITTDWEGTTLSGIDLAWDYHARNANQTCRISMKGYIPKVLLKAQNASRTSSALTCIMREPWIISYSSASALSDHSRPPPYSAQMKPLTKFSITAPLTLQMAFSIALATWSYVHILKQGSTMRARDAVIENLVNGFICALYGGGLL